MISRPLAAGWVGGTVTGLPDHHSRQGPGLFWTCRLCDASIRLDSKQSIYIHRNNDMCNVERGRKGMPSWTKWWNKLQVKESGDDGVKWMKRMIWNMISKMKWDICVHLLMKCNDNQAMFITTHLSSSSRPLQLPSQIDSSVLVSMPSVLHQK